MKRKLISIILATLMIFALSLNSFAAYVGNAAYRDFGASIVYPLGHSGIVDVVFSGKVTYIIHMTSSGLQRVSLSTFKSGATPQPPSSYWGEYGINGTSNTTYSNVRAKANQLYQRSSSIS